MGVHAPPDLEPQENGLPAPLLNHDLAESTSAPNGKNQNATATPRAFRSLAALLESMKGWVENDSAGDEGGTIIL